jgi:hypothetical protein
MRREVLWASHRDESVGRLLFDRVEGRSRTSVVAFVLVEERKEVRDGGKKGRLYT